MSERGWFRRRPVLAVAALVMSLASPGCSYVFTSGPPDTPLDVASARMAVADPPCTQSAVWPWVDVVFVASYVAVATASTSGAIEIDLPTAIGLVVGTGAHVLGAWWGFGRVAKCDVYMIAARSMAAQAALGPPPGVIVPLPTAPPGPGVPPPPVVQGGPGVPPPPVVQGGPGVPPPPVVQGGPPGITISRVQSLRRGQQNAAQLVQMFGEPLSRAPLPAPSPLGCVQIWTWLRGTTALSVGLSPDGTVCEVATAGPPPPP